jgi:hypothetical protein
METRTFDDLLRPCPESVRSLARAARQFLLQALPEAQETIDGSASLVGYGYGRGYKGLVCTLLLSKTGVKLGLAHGAALPDPGHLLEGTGKVHKFVQVRNAGDLRKPDLKALIRAASFAAQQRSGPS